MIDPTNQGDLDRFYRAVEWSRWRLHRLLMIKEFVRAHYSDTGADEPVPLNADVPVIVEAPCPANPKLSDAT